MSAQAAAAAKPTLPKPPSSGSTQSAASTANNALNIETFGQKPEDLDVARNNEPINDFQAKSVELKNQRPQWVTYKQ
jgi:hypothetical protein